MINLRRVGGPEGLIDRGHRMEEPTKLKVELGSGDVRVKTTIKVEGRMKPDAKSPT
jgi:DUF4097 and DUF4098 domain-containing protein YvlB